MNTTELIESMEHKGLKEILEALQTTFNLTEKGSVECLRDYLQKKLNRTV